jgi:transcriptional regulator GlxA family with amidase domain
MKKVSVYVPEHAAIGAVNAAYRLFKAANDFLNALGKTSFFDVEYVGLKNYVATDEGEYLIKTNRLIKDVKTTDLVILPATYGDISRALKTNEEVIPWVKKMHHNGSEIASLCNGAFLLAETGLINGKRCSTHWAYFNQFREMFPTVNIVEGSIITDERRIYSSGGANSIWNLLLYLLEKYTDRNTTVLAAKYFAVDIDRYSQGAFTIFTGQKDHNDKEILQVQNYIEKSYANKLSIDDLIDKVDISRRSFERRFKQATNSTPVEYMQRVRIEASKRSFESSRKNVSEVMFDVGYSDIKAFRNIFKRVTGITPIEYMRKYRKVTADVDIKEM